VKLSITGRSRNYIFFTSLFIVAISLVITLMVASKQDKVYKENFQQYQHANQLIAQNQYQQAEILLTQLNPAFKNSYQVQYGLAACAAGMGDYDAAVQYMQDAQDAAATLIVNQSFLFTYGKYLFMQGDYHRASLYLLESKKYPTDPQTLLEADRYLQEIRNMGSSGREKSSE